MSTPTGLWQRVKRVFHGPDSEASPYAGNNGAPAEAARDAAGRADSPSPLEAADKEAGRWRRPANALAPRDVSQRIVDLADALQKHFEQADTRAAELARALDRVGEILEQLADTQRHQGETLKTIATQSEATGRHTAGLSDTVSRIPESLLAQAEAIRTVSKQIELGQDVDTRLLESLKTFSQAVDTLGNAGVAQVETLQRLSAAQQDQHAALRGLVREQSKRLLIAVGIAALLGLAGIVGLAVALALQLK